jgi:hypothetical protein
MREVNPLKTTYQRNFLCGTLIALLIFLVPSMIYYFIEDYSVVKIPIGKITETGPGLEIKEVRAGIDAGIERNSTNRFAHRIDGGWVVENYRISNPSKTRIVPGLAPNIMPIDILPVEGENNDFEGRQESDGNIRTGVEADGWPLGDDALTFNPTGLDLSIGYFQRKFMVYPCDQPVHIILHPARWPDKARRSGIDSCVITAQLTIGADGGIVDEKGRLNCVILNEDPAGFDFSESFRQMLRDGSYFAATYQGQRISSTITMIHYFCKNCPQSTKVEGNVIVSFSF